MELKNLVVKNKGIEVNQDINIENPKPLSWWLEQSLSIWEKLKTLIVELSSSNMELICDKWKFIAID